MREIRVKGITVLEWDDILVRRFYPGGIAFDGYKEWPDDGATFWSDCCSHPECYRSVNVHKEFGGPVTKAEADEALRIRGWRTGDTNPGRDSLCPDHNVKLGSI